MASAGDYAPAVVSSVKERKHMDVIESIIRAVLMIGFLVIIVMVVAALFMIVFGIGTGIDDRLHG